MEFNYSSTECEKSCRDIHRSWNELSRLGAALAHLTRSERRQIKDTYRAMFHDDLVERLHGEHMSNPKNEVYISLYSGTQFLKCTKDFASIAFNMFLNLLLWIFKLLNCDFLLCQFLSCTKCCTFGCLIQLREMPFWWGMLLKEAW